METLGSLIDKLTIVNLRIWKFEDIKRGNGRDSEIADATRKTNILNEQRNDLIQEINNMAVLISNNEYRYKDYSQGETKIYK